MTNSTLRSMNTGVIGSWLIKASSYGRSFCVVLFNRVDHETYVNFFEDPRDAQRFIERVTLE